MVQELLVSLAEAAAVVTPGWSGDGRVAEARVVSKVWRTPGGHIMASGLKAVVDTLIVDLDCRRRRPIGGLRMRAPDSHERSRREQRYSEDFFHGPLLEGRGLAARTEA